MFCTRNNFSTGLAILLFSVTGAFAGDNRDANMQLVGAGDPVAGKAKSVSCQVCHGEDGNSVSEDVPKLAGQYAAYIQKRIREFQSDSRNNSAMSKHAAALTNKQDLLDICAYFASQEPMKGDHPVDNPVGRTHYLDDATGCTQCHVISDGGADYVDHLMPKIAGQHKAYMVKQFYDYKKGVRTSEINGTMIMILGYMSDEEIEAVASYVSGLQQK